MTRQAKDVQKGDLLVTSGVRIESAMTAEGHTYLSYGEGRPIDSFHGNDTLPTIYPANCPHCGHQLIEDDDE